MGKKVSSFFQKIQLAALDVPVAFIFLAIAISGCIVAFSVTKSALYLEGSDKFEILSREARSSIVSRINHTLDFPLTLARSIPANASKGDLDEYIQSLGIESRYPGIHEVGIYATSGSNLKRLYRYSVYGVVTDAITEAELKNSVLVKNNNNSLFRFRAKEPLYVVLTPIEKDSYLFTVIDGGALLSHIAIDGGVFADLKISVVDSIDRSVPLYQTGNDFSSRIDDDYTKDDQIKTGLYPWVITTKANQSQLLGSIASVVPLTVLLFGVAISLIVFYLIYSVGESRAKELRLTEEIKNSLQIGKDKYEHAVGGLQSEINAQKKITADLHLKVKELERLNKLMIGRELRMVELKNEITKLHEKK